jgi:hypothetical protein
MRHAEVRVSAKEDTSIAAAAKSDVSTARKRISF